MFEMKPNVAHEIFVMLDNNGELRILVKDRDAPRVHDITDELRAQFDKMPLD